MPTEIIEAETARWRELDARHHLHPFSDQAVLAAKGVWVITRAEGCWLWDSEGNRILDGMAGLWCVNVGYGRAELVKPQGGYVVNQRETNASCFNDAQDAALGRFLVGILTAHEACPR